MYGILKPYSARGGGGGEGGAKNSSDILLIASDILRLILSYGSMICLGDHTGSYGTIGGYMGQLVTIRDHMRP